MEADPPIPIEQDQLTVTVARTGKATVVHNAQGHPLLSTAQRHVGAIASIPLLKSGHVLGVFDISFTEPHNFARDELRVLHMFADQAAIAIENAQLYTDAQHAKEAKNKFVNLISQELKEPMTSIQGYARLMAMRIAGPVTEQQQAFLDVIQENVWRMVELVDRMTDLSDIESERTPSRADF